MKTRVKYFYLNFIKKEEISKDVFAFYFDRKKADLDFLAGQYLHLYLPIGNEKGRGNSRMFTVASSPLDKNYIFIVTKKGKSLFKKNLFRLLPQVKVKFYGPSGGLVLDETKKLTYVFLAPGIGITPFLSMIKYISQKKLDISVTLFASFSQKEDVFFYDELIDIANANSNIQVIYTLTRINAGLIKRYITDIKKPLYFVTGSPAMVSGIASVLEEMQVPNEKIRIENFTGY